MNCISGTPRPPRPPLFCPSWTRLMSLRQNGGSQLSNVNRESPRWRDGGPNSEDFPMFHPELWTLSRRSLYFVALRMFFDLPEESSHSPVFPSMPSSTTDKHTFGFSHTTPSTLKPSARVELFLRASDGQHLHPSGLASPGRGNEGLNLLTRTARSEGTRDGRGPGQPSPRRDTTFSR